MYNTYYTNGATLLITLKLLNSIIIIIEFNSLVLNINAFYIANNLYFPKTRVIRHFIEFFTRYIVVKKHWLPNYSK